MDSPTSPVSMFKEPGPLWDLVVECEDGELHTSKAVVGMWSPVLRDLLLNIDGVTHLPLHNKNTDEVLVLLKYLCPPYKQLIKRVGEAQVLLPLAHEYNISNLKDRAEDKLCEALQTRRHGGGWQQVEEETVDAFCLEKAVEIACRYEAPKLRSTCEELMDEMPCTKYAVLAEEYKMQNVLNTCVAFIGNHLKDILDHKQSAKELEQLSSQTLLQVMVYLHKKTNAEIELARADSNSAKHAIQSIKSRLTAMTFNNEEHEALTGCKENEWKDLGITYGSAMSFFSDGAFISRTFRRKIEEVFQSEGQGPLTLAWGNV